MNVDVNELQNAFADQKWNEYVEEAYMINVCSPNDKSSYTKKERNKDRMLLIELININPEYCFDNIKLL